MQTERIRIADLPGATIDCAWDYIVQFTVGLGRIVRKKNTEDFRLIGTGTLVLLENLYCILTAEHVLAKVRDTDRLGLLSSFSGQLRPHAFDQSHLRIHRIARGNDDAKGPDIGLVVLPQADIGSLRAEKTFFNIDKRRERFSKGFLERDRGFWLTCGIIGESEIELDPRPGFNAIKGYRALCGASGIAAEFEDSGFDYLDVEIDYSTPNQELPSSFGGLSGGGIWHVPLTKNQHGEIIAEEYVLSGVVFYQSAVEGSTRRLRCHGRETVYVKVPDFLKHKNGS